MSERYMVIGRCGASRAAVSYRVGSLGELQQIPPEGLDEAQLYTLRTLAGVEWYDVAGNRTDAPPFGVTDT